MTRQRTAELRGAFADRLPPATPTLRQLAERALTDAAILRGAAEHEWNEAYHTACDSEFAFRKALMAATGFDARLMDALGREGLL